MFEHKRGACSSFHDDVYLCFDKSNNKKCRSSIDPLGNFSDVVSSTFSHGYSRTAMSESKLAHLDILIAVLSRATCRC